MQISTIKFKIIALFKQGLSAKEVAQSILVAALISIIPILGVSTFLITMLSIKWKLNLPIMIALSYVMWPVQMVLIIPFISIGATIFGVPQSEHSIDEIVLSFQNSFFKTLSNLSFELLCGFGGWLLTAVPAAIFINVLMVFLFRMVAKKSETI
jgi:uncharacterized protein (DUF2062 family)